MIVLSACRAPLPEPELAKHPPNAFQPVPYPPPPARPEFVPEQPDPAAVWIDGEWFWREVRWVWLYGRWVKPPKDAAFARWDWKRTRDGRLWIAPGKWQDEHGRPLAHPNALRIANATEGDRVDDEGRLVDVGANDRARKVKPPPRTTDCVIKRPLATKTQ
ncbi:MAG TPA: hypothetical protein VFB62_12770 [Polyangiaceae bacterium]|jgi:hypothetical protein|nr:hypothetical protein [Polyangiaceae bacterium]